MGLFLVFMFVVTSRIALFIYNCHIFVPHCLSLLTCVCCITEDCSQNQTFQGKILYTQKNLVYLVYTKATSHPLLAFMGSNAC